MPVIVMGEAAALIARRTSAERTLLENIDRWLSAIGLGYQGRVRLLTAFEP